MLAAHLEKSWRSLEGTEGTKEGTSSVFELPCKQDNYTNNVTVCIKKPLLISDDYESKEYLVMD